MTEKYAISFFLTIEDGEIVEYSYVHLISSETPDLEGVGVFEFDPDYLDWLREESDILALPSGDYHIFHFGELHWEYSNNLEYGTEFEGLIFNPTEKHIRLLK